MKDLLIVSALVLLVGVILFSAGGCCRTHPAEVFPMETPPDRSCDTGGAGGYDVWTWDCHKGKRVVIARLRGEWGCNDPIKEQVACGDRTPFEKEHAEQLARCGPMPPDFHWPR